MATALSGTPVPSDFYGGDLPGATGSASDPYFGFSLSSTTSNCDACYYVNGVEAMCSQVNGCTQTTTETPVATHTATTTETAVIPPSATADCQYW